MQTKKMSLANIQGKLSRAEMKNIMAGSGEGTCTLSCFTSSGGTLACLSGIGGSCIAADACSNASTCK
jgi:hypothetical protein